MSNLSNQQINETFQGLLQVPGGIDATLKTVQDGNGNATGLQISSTGVNAATADSATVSNDGIAATGATARLISDKFADVISVKDFGAVGDGVTDDTVSLQNAINQACLTGSPLFLGNENETYLITSGLTAKAQTDLSPQSGSVHFYNTVPFVFMGRGNACIKAGASMTNMLTLIFNSPYNEIAPFYSKIEGIFFDANNFATTAVQSNYDMHVTFVRNRIENATNGLEFIGYGVANIRDNVFLCNNGIWLHDGGGDTIINHNDFFYTAIGSSGVLINGWGGNTEISANIFNIESIAGTCYAIKADNSSYASHEIRNLRILSNEFYGCVGFKAIGNATGTRNVYDCTIAFNHTTNNGSTGQYGALVDAIYCTNLDISNNFGGGYFYGATNAVPVILTSCSYCKVNSNTFAALSNQAVTVDSCVHTQINQNKFINFGQGSASYNAITLAGSTNNTQILSNQAVQESASYAVNFVVETGSANTTYYSDNTCSAVITNPVTFIGASSVDATNYFATTASSININTIGAKNVYIRPGSSGTGLQISYVNNAVNYPVINPTILGSGFAEMSVAGSDTNIDLRLSPKGTGKLLINTASSAASNPASFSATRYLPIKDSSGTTYYIPVTASTW